MSARAIWELLRDTGLKWYNDGAPRLGASLAFYTMLSLAPLLVVVTAIAAFAFGEEAARGRLVDEIRDLAGTEGGKVIQTLLEHAYRRPGQGTFATVVGVLMLLFGASSVFAQLQEALNLIWGVQAKAGGGVLAVVRDRFLSFSMVLGLGFLLLVSLVFSAALTALGNYAGGLLPGYTAVLHVLHLLLSVLLLSVLFALMFKFLPDARVAWRDVWVGAVVTAVLFSVGKYLIGLYLGSSGVGSAYGAAGSFAVFLVWVYYSAQILLFGAAFTQVYANRFGSHVLPEGGTKPPREVPGRIAV